MHHPGKDVGKRDVTAPHREVSITLEKFATADWSVTEEPPGLIDR